MRSGIVHGAEAIWLRVRRGEHTTGSICSSRPCWSELFGTIVAFLWCWFVIGSLTHQIRLGALVDESTRAWIKGAGHYG